MTRCRGTTLIELLMAATLLVLLTGALFQILVPVLRNASRMDAKQDNIQRLIVFREELMRRLLAGKVRAVTQTSIEFYLPEMADTDIGRLPKINDAEMVTYDDTRYYEILSEPSGVVVERTRRTADDATVARRVLLSLGDEGSVRYDAPELPTVQVTLRARSGQVSKDSAPWERSFHLVLDRYFEPQD